LKRLVAEEAGRSACKIQKVSHRLVCDLAETFARYPSFTQHGEVWAAQATLASQLGVDVRQVRRALSVLLELKVLSIKRPSRGQRRDTNTMVALLDERPLFAEVEDEHRVSPSAEYRTPTSPDHRATASFNSKEEELKKDSSPVGPSDTSRRETPVAKEEESNFEELNSGGRCSQHDPRPCATKANSSKTGDDGAVAFAQLMRVYPHPRGQREKPAYEPMARRAWGALSNAQKAEAIDAAPYARGKTWLGHWLNDARETGIFELMKQPAAGPPVWVSENTPQHAAWTEYYRSRGPHLPTTQHRVNGELRTGWFFESEWPPKFKLVQRGGGSA
jgi:hypothetical protein